ncbi:MAG: type IX secretion system membrane protein PorP/SprF [Bacteroidetes bacterium]|nr:type IX secretion system membrane protein PorP/SprF [Bacteroidota bacterium]HET6244410.1 type IX secretion system membrane protein PorP/SprF [Bacteroidia bacterium]
MKKFLSSICLTLVVSLGFAQQDAQFSQYMFNPFVLNPAYAGSREAFTALAINRNQWINIPGAPNTQTLSLNTPLTTRVGVGLQVFNDAIGPKNSVGYLASYAYRIPLSVGKLAFGLRAGGITYNFHWDKIDYKDQADVYNFNSRTQTTVFNADFGLFYNTKKFYTGLSANHIGYAQRITPVKLEGIESHLRMHFFYTLGNTFEINDRLALQPSILIKAVENAPLSTDLNVNLIIDHKVWVGVSFRPKNSVVLLTQFRINENFRFGYSYDIGINRIGRLARGSHELFIGYDFNLRKVKSISPRYF